MSDNSTKRKMFAFLSHFDDVGEWMDLRVKVKYKCYCNDQASKLAIMFVSIIFDYFFSRVSIAS